VILLDWILIGALDGVRLALEVEPLILFVEWSGFETVELLELQTITPFQTVEANRGRIPSSAETCCLLPAAHLRSRRVLGGHT
jgi:hypothetical protein